MRKNSTVGKSYYNVSIYSLLKSIITSNEYDFYLKYNTMNSANHLK